MMKFSNFNHKQNRPAWSLVLAILLATPQAGANENGVQITEDGQYRYITSNGIPDHAHGKFPNAGNPNTISPQEYTFRVPKNPQLTGRDTDYGHNLFGVALNGIPFDPGTAEFWNNDPNSGWNYEALSGKINLGIDQNHAHVQPNGAYHYHGIPDGLLQNAQRNQAGYWIGYAADGFTVYYQAGKRSSYQIKKGNRNSGPGGKYDGTFVQDYEYEAGSGDLDSCNGETVTDNSGENYRYYLTEKFPFVPRCLKGMPDASFQKQAPHQAGGRGGQPGMGRGPGGQGSGQQMGPGGGMGQRMPPREAVIACENSADGDACRFQSPHGAVSGTCRNVPGNITACVPEGHHLRG